ncbi:MAG: hypothetical protein D6706_04380 [Chloroflexi bacterium]|nr:MAG: hypothetical protein D6706_04380 [Chloroflexota bacterium]
MSEELFYKVSFVVQGGKHPGAIITVEKRPQVGDEVIFNGSVFRVIEVMELMPPVGNFMFLHATCEYVREVTDEE